MHRLYLDALHKTVCSAVGGVALLHAAPCLAQDVASTNFARKSTLSMESFAGSTGRFTDRRQPSGPVDASGSMLPSSTWRTCGNCTYRSVTPKPFHSFAIHANFQPIGGTFSYRF